TGTTSTYTFPNTGYFTVTVKAKDNAGNVSPTASFSVQVVDAPKPRIVLTGSSSHKPPLAGGVGRLKHGKVTLVVKGLIKIPNGLTAAQTCSTTVIVTVRAKHYLVT